MKITLATLRVLRALVDTAGKPCYGYDLMQASHLKSGTLYPILDRLLAEGMLLRSTETSAPPSGGPARQYYVITAEGLALARQHLAEASAAIAPRTQAWVPGPLADGSAT